MPGYKVNINTVVKFGQSVRLAAAAAIGLVRKRTTIPVRWGRC
jgi:hypothetical protein